MSEDAALKIAKRMTPPDWFGGTALRRVMSLLNGEDSGDKSPKALMVGGCVRNVLVGKSVHDIDIATILTPDEVTKALQKEGVKIIPTGRDHGTVTAVFDSANAGVFHTKFEITTLRRDVETDGRHAVVAYTQDWREDAQRRDFTMNTLLADIDGNIYDPLGCGLADLEARRVVFVGEAKQRIAEDYLRVLRFFRFYGTYGQGGSGGQGGPDEAAMLACKAAAPHVLKLSKERIAQEFFKILELDNSVDVLQYMQNIKLLTPLFSNEYQSGVLQSLVILQARYGARDLMARLCVLGGFEPEFGEKCGVYVLLSKAQQRDLNLYAALIDVMTADDAVVKTIIYRHGNHIAQQAVLLYAARQEKKSDIDVDAMMRLAMNWQAPSLPMNGDDITALGVAHGPQIGELRAAIEEWWMERDFTPMRDECLEQLKQMVEV